MPLEKIKKSDIYYEVLRTGQETIMFLNDFAMTTESWEAISFFFQKEYRCVLHDFQGQLMSGKPDFDFNMEIHVEDMKNLMEHLQIEKVHLLGTSYGSEVGMIFAYTYPEKVKTLTVIDSVSEVDALLRKIIDRTIQRITLGLFCGEK